MASENEHPLHPTPTTSSSKEASSSAIASLEALSEMFKFSQSSLDSELAKIEEVEGLSIDPNEPEKLYLQETSKHFYLRLQNLLHHLRRWVHDATVTADDVQHDTLFVDISAIKLTENKISLISKACSHVISTTIPKRTNKSGGIYTLFFFCGLHAECEEKTGPANMMRSLIGQLVIQRAARGRELNLPSYHQNEYVKNGSLRALLTLFNYLIRQLGPDDIVYCVLDRISAYGEEAFIRKDDEKFGIDESTFNEIYEDKEDVDTVLREHQKASEFETQSQVSTDDSSSSGGWHLDKIDPGTNPTIFDLLASNAGAKIGLRDGGQATVKLLLTSVREFDENMEVDEIVHILEPDD
ncbi:hypothetical protein CC80DRAFT_560550 [Byssothecium circinans]|uniref:Uncharacterized protein n=1 Tax=Byssothecium circinans TaxID=147558 RepID=A0A6A5U0G9_9PLEO|nr:hypothetical protein CC80DRAFT_560550 [Byssothecium circinans]